MSVSNIALRKRQLEREAGRLLILQALAEDANYSVTHYVLIQLLGEYSHAATDVRRDLVWLEGHGLITSQSVGPAEMPEATITRQGEDVAHGRSSISGIARPRWGE